MKTLTAALAAIVLSFAANVAAAGCLDRIDMTDATGEGSAGLPAIICKASVMEVVLKSATVSDTFFDAAGSDMIATRIKEIEAGTLTEAAMKAQSAKLVEVEFRAGKIIAFTNEKLRDKIETYMAAVYIGLFEQAVPMRRVRVAALYPMQDGSEGVVYGTVIENYDGAFGVGNLPKGWKVWRLNRDLR